MRLTLSSAAAPAFTLEELLDGCARRGLSGLELVQGHAHGLGPTSDAATIAAARERAERRGVHLLAYRADAASVATREMARLSRFLDAPVIAPPEWWAGTAAHAGAAATNSSRGQTPRLPEHDPLRGPVAAAANTSRGQTPRRLENDPPPGPLAGVANTSRGQTPQRLQDDTAPEPLEAAANTSRGQTPLLREDDPLRGALALYHEEGGRLLLAHGSDPAAIGALRQALEAAGAGAVAGLAWDAVPSMEAPIDARAVLTAAGAGLRHIRLHGGGPEAAAQAGQGIGELLGLLALSGYPGALALAPSTPRYLTAWGFWLGRRGWGCGSSREEKAAVPLTSARQESIA